MAEQRTDFSDLVRDRRAELGISLRELEARSIDPESGTQVKFGWLSKVENRKPIDTPSLHQIQALKEGLQLPLAVLQEAAAAEFLGLDKREVWSRDRSTRILAARIEEMNATERRQLAEIAETFARRRTQGDRNSDD
ncbi:XRE family transcriptional regulator [Streptomyces sp. NPDC052114]|uniref:XRE family transcriptional regulator n=1 Tax=unclassified Streptomyces TaxID=2593676 RepID=UPI00343A4DED